MTNTKLTKYNPCWCGSGRFYKDCHLTIDQAAPEQRVSAAQELYRRDWGISAAHINEQRAYDWMASKLKPFAPKLVFDVGCGTGEGILALLRAFSCRVVSVDENKACVQTACARLSAEGYDVGVSERLSFVPTAANRHLLAVQAGQLSATHQVSILEGDLLSEDEELFGFLRTSARFDAVTIWLVGSHLLRIECENVRAFRPRSSGEYRTYVQNKAYELADRVLRPGGVFQVVDRGDISDEERLHRITLESHCDQASVTTLRDFQIEHMPYTELDGSSGVSMITAQGKPGKIDKRSRLGIISVISRKL